MAERDAGAETCDGGQTLEGLDDEFGGDQTIIRMMQTRMMDDNESESEVEENGHPENMGGVGGTTLHEEKENNGGKEEEEEKEAGMEKGDGTGPIIFEMSPRNSMDLNDHWPPDPWSLQYLEREMFWKWDSNPCWDIELMPSSWDCEDDEEIIWEDDIWHLRDIKEVPSVSHLRK